jgi:hypothetical protein
MKRDRFREAVGGVAFVALLTFTFLVVAEWRAANADMTQIGMVR